MAGKSDACGSSEEADEEEEMRDELDAGEEEEEVPVTVANGDDQLEGTA